MKIYSSWKRNTPDTVTGDSITITIMCCSFQQEEIDELEERLVNGVIVMDTDEDTNDITGALAASLGRQHDTAAWQGLAVSPFS